MIIVDGPYISDFLKNTITQNQFPVVDTHAARHYLDGANAKYLSENQAIKRVQSESGIQLYTPSESSINWITKNLLNTGLPEKINLFKDKTRFRKMLADMYPGFLYLEVAYGHLDEYNISDLPRPFVIKPAVGFFSMGVYTVTENSDWHKILQSIHHEIEALKGLYPREVLDATKFIIEEYIEGEEYAFDAYFNEQGEPVILGIMKHLFASETDVSDRVYFTSPDVISDYLEPFRNFLKKIGMHVPLRNFPLHTEVRIDSQGIIRPIEINPMRFGGWCTSAELFNHAFGFNPYEMLLLHKKPDWKTIINQHKGHVTSLIILDNSTGIDKKNIQAFDFDKLLKGFENPLELRKADFRKYPQFGFLYVESRKENFTEVERILHSTLKEYVVSEPVCCKCKMA